MTSTVAQGFFYQPQVRQNTKQSNQDKNSVLKFKDSLVKQVKQDTKFLYEIPIKAKNANEALTEINSRRLQIVFSKITSQELLLLIKEQNILINLEKFFHTQIDIARLNAVNGAFNAISVGLYGLRFLITFAAAIQEGIAKSSKNNTDVLKSIGNELTKVHADLLNDFVWGTINTLTNFAAFFRIAPFVCDVLIGVFLCFDIAQVGYNLWLKNLAFQSERKKIEQEILELEQLNTIESQDKINACNVKLKKKEETLQIDTAKFLYLMGGASVLFSGFALTVLLTIPGGQPLAFFICTVGIAMYATAGEFEKYKQAKMDLEKNPECTKAKEQVSKARNEFIISFTKNLLIPTILLTAFTLYWPAGVALIITCLLYEYMKRAWDNKDKKDAPIDTNGELDEDNNDVHATQETFTDEQTPLLKAVDGDISSEVELSSQNDFLEEDSQSGLRMNSSF